MFKQIMDSVCKSPRIISQLSVILCDSLYNFAFKIYIYKKKDRIGLVSMYLTPIYILMETLLLINHCRN
jgi:hypothetical protein